MARMMEGFFPWFTFNVESSNPQQIKQAPNEQTRKQPGYCAFNQCPYDCPSPITLA